jgi:tetratricopeptide (TPR) repeat protein
MYPHNNGADYDQVIRVEKGSIYNKTNIDFVQITHSHDNNVTDIMTINGTKVNPDDPYGDISYQTYGEIARYKEQIYEAKRAADLKNISEKHIKTQDEALQIDPQNSTAWTIKGLTLYNLNKYDEAIKAYDEAIRINPRNSKAWIYKALVLRDLGRYDEAIKANEKAIEINPENSTAWTNKGFALYSLNKYDEALAAYDKAIEINPKNEAAWYFKGDALYKLDKSDKAGKAWDKQNDIRESNLISDRNKVIEINPHSSEA